MFHLTFILLMYHVHYPQCTLTRLDHVMGNLRDLCPLQEIYGIKSCKIPVAFITGKIP